MILTIQVAAISSPIGCYARAYLSRNTRNRQPEDDFPLVVYLCLLPPFNRKALPFGCAIPMRCCVSVTALCRSPNSSTFTGGRFTFSRHVSRRRFIHSRSSSSVHNSMTSIHRAAALRYSPFDSSSSAFLSLIISASQIILNQHSPALNQQHSDSFVIGPLFSG